TVKGNSRNIHDSFNMELKTSKSEYEWLNACYIGTVKSPESMTSLGAQLNKVGISKCDMRPIKGNLVLLSANRNETMEKIMSDNQGKLARRFTLVQPWEKQDVGYNRITWVQCTGIYTSVAEETPGHGDCFNNWCLYSESHLKASLSVDPPVSFVAESKQSGRNRKFGGEVAKSPARAAAGINEGFQNSSVSEQVSDTIRTSRDTAHKVGGTDTTDCRHSKGRDVDYIEARNHGSNELGLGLVNNGDDNMSLYSISQGNQNKERAHWAAWASNSNERESSNGKLPKAHKNQEI
ncbi:hypothetical protein Ancab_021160, partial [Ancistrocladus abbreviatus]